MGRGVRYPFIGNILKAYRGNPGSMVLEIGAGGAVYRDLFEKYVGTDLPGNTYAEKGDLAVYCDAQRIPFRDASFDMAFVVAALYQIPDVGDVFNEVRRVLKAGGAFLIFDYNEKRTRRLKLAERDGNNRNHVWSPDGLRKLANERGFKAKVLNHHTYFPSSGGLLGERVKGCRLYHRARDLMREDWNVVVARR